MCSRGRQGAGGLAGGRAGARLKGCESLYKMEFVRARRRGAAGSYWACTNARARSRGAGGRARRGRPWPPSLKKGAMGLAPQPKTGARQGVAGGEGRPCSPLGFWSTGQAASRASRLGALQRWYAKQGRGRGARIPRPESAKWCGRSAAQPALKSGARRRRGAPPWGRRASGPPPRSARKPGATARPPKNGPAA